VLPTRASPGSEDRVLRPALRNQNVALGPPSALQAYRRRPDSTVTQGPGKADCGGGRAAGNRHNRRGEQTKTVQGKKQRGGVRLPDELLAWVLALCGARWCLVMADTRSGALGPWCPSRRLKVLKTATNGGRPRRRNKLSAPFGHGLWEGRVTSTIKEHLVALGESGNTTVIHLDLWFLVLYLCSLPCWPWPQGWLGIWALEGC